MKMAVLAFTMILLSGCTVGPDFKHPIVVTPQQWAGKELADSKTVSKDYDPQWWNIFHDATLSGLINHASENNYDLRIAGTRLLQAEAQSSIVSGDKLPSASIDSGYQRARNSENGLQDISGLEGRKAYSVWQSSASLNWEPDFWGQVHRAVEAANARTEASAELRRGMLLTVQAETARNYILLRGIQAQIITVQQNLNIAQNLLRLTLIRQKAGVSTGLDVSEARARVAETEAVLPALAQQQHHLVNALSYLSGEMPETLSARLTRAAPLPVIPAEVPVGLPSELVKRRPDIRVAEARLHAATAETGVAVASFYPSVTLSANAGVQAMQFSQAWAPGSGFFNIGPVINLPIFEGGKLHGQLVLRQAQQQEAALRFQQTVLNAWHETDDAMSDYDTLQQQRQKLETVVSDTHTALKNAQQQYLSGASDFLNVLTVQKALLDARQALVISNTNVSLSLVQLYKALGGGWQAPLNLIPADPTNIRNNKRINHG